MSKRLFGNILATLAAIAMGVCTTLVSIWYLNMPEKLLDWTMQVFAGVTVGIIVFFMVWGHFQGDEEPVKT